MRWLINLLGPMVFVFSILSPAPVGLSGEGWLVAGLAGWMILWWIKGVVPLAVTSLLPLVIMPLAGLADGPTLGNSYANATVILVLGGFTLGIAIEKHAVHETVARYLLAKVSPQPHRLLAVTMGLTAGFSMWISNTATTIMMLPIVIAAVQRLPSKLAISCSTPFMLGVAYAASIGGMMTLIGTATNAQFKGYVETQINSPLDFVTWMIFAVPIGLLMLIAAWAVLAIKIPKQSLDLGDTLPVSEPHTFHLSTPQKRVCVVFLLTISAWVLSGTVISPLLGRSIPDSSIAILTAITFFLIPTGVSAERLLCWPDMKKLPWDVLLLLGGGLALAKALDSSGVAAWTAELIPTTDNPMITLALCLLLVLAVSEFMSNVAAVAALLPILTSIASSSELNFVAFTAPVILAASCAFMLPMSTPPNAIVFANGSVTIRDMARAGLLLNTLGFAVMLLLAAPLANWLLN